MTGLEFTATLVRASVDILIALAWPVAAVTIALIFRREIHRLLNDLRSLKMGPVDAHFRQEMDEAQAIATEISTDSSLNDELNNDSEIDSSIKLDQLAMSAHPTGVIMESWKVIESMLNNVAEKYQLADPKRSSEVIGITGKRSLKPTPMPERLLLMRELINSEESELLKRMRYLRNQVAHSRGLILSAADVAEYLQLTLTAERFLTRLLRDQETSV